MRKSETNRSVESPRQRRRRIFAPVERDDYGSVLDRDRPVRCLQPLGTVPSTNGTVGSGNLSAPTQEAVPSRGKAARPWVDAEHYAIRTTLDGRQLGGSAVITLTPRVAGIPVLPVTISHKLCIHTATLNDDLRVETWPDSTKILTRAFSDRTARMPMPQSCSLTRSSAVRPFSSGSTTRVGAVLQRPGRFLLCEGSGQLVSKLRDILRPSQVRNDLQILPKSGHVGCHGPAGE